MESRYELELAKLRSHERHMAYIYRLRWGGLALAAFTICIGAVMTFAGLQGSFDWAFQAPSSLSAKLTNASPGIVFATVGLLIGLLTVIQKPVNYDTGYDGDHLGSSITIRDKGPPPSKTTKSRRASRGASIFIGR
jgi:hypothetical protein